MGPKCKYLPNAQRFLIFNKLVTSSLKALHLDISKERLANRKMMCQNKICDLKILFGFNSKQSMEEQKNFSVSIMTLRT